MCGRYELHSHPAAIALAFGLGAAPPVAPRYNIAPMQQVPIVRVNAQGARELAFVRWGLVPRWAKDPSIGARMINARGETLKEKPAFRTAFRRHRCLVPADGFYEWKSRGDGTKQPMRIAMRDGTPFAFAGLTERWLGPDGEPLDTCVIVTTDGDPAVAARAYRAKLSQAGGRVSNEQDFAEGHYGISGEIDVSSKLYVVVNLAIGKADDAAGFYGSATLWERE